MAHNRIETVPEWIGELEGLEILGLNNNSIRTLPKSLANLDLSELQVQNNPLTVCVVCVTHILQSPIGGSCTNLHLSLPTWVCVAGNSMASGLQGRAGVRLKAGGGRSPSNPFRAAVYSAPPASACPNRPTNHFVTSKPCP